MDLSFDYEPKMSREAMKDEALDRMELLGLPSYAKAAFKVDDYLTLSDISDKVCQSRVDGVPEDIKKLIKEFEEKFGALIFHVIHTKGLYVGFEYYDCLSVSPYESDWDYERDMMEDRGDTWAMSYSINVTKPEYTESGTIKIENHSGVLKRVLQHNVMTMYHKIKEGHLWLMYYQIRKYVNVIRSQKIRNSK